MVMESKDRQNLFELAGLSECLKKEDDRKEHSYKKEFAKF